MNKTQTIFNALFLVIIGILIVLSAIALIAIHWELSSHSFTFTPKGVNNYLAAIGEYKNLLGATVAAIAAYFGLLRLKAATDQNADKLRQDRFSEWKTVLDIRFIEIERNDPYMKREFTRVRYNLFQQLYPLGFKISRREEITNIFQTIFADLVYFFETQNYKHIGMGGIYPDANYSYSFDSFQFLILGCVDDVYGGILADLKNLFISKLPADRTIDSELYRAALLNYRPIRN